MTSGRVATPTSEFPFGSWAAWSGTSFSAPHVAGAVARRCLADLAISAQQQAIEELFDGQQVLAGFGRVFYLLSGTAA